jgi:hypothetical protein
MEGQVKGYSFFGLNQKSEEQGQEAALLAMHEVGIQP